MTDTTEIGAEDVAEMELPIGTLPEGVRAGATHSHAFDAAVRTLEVTCSACSKVQAFTVPADHDGSGVKWTCSSCATDNWLAAGQAPAELHVDVPGAVAVSGSDAGAAADNRG